MSREMAIFKKGSTTFYMSSLFFPKDVRRDVADLYSFVRVADDYVDRVPADKDGFYRLRRLWEEAISGKDKLAGNSIDERVVGNMLRVSQKHAFDQSWIESFLDAMQSDLVRKDYKTLTDSLAYVYGSAEVIGLMMARIMGLPPEADQAAILQGRAFQWINFIRDIEEDNRLGRQYFPSEDLKKFNLPDLSEKTARRQPGDFAEFVRFQTDRYTKWQSEAADGYKYIPKRLLIPLRTASGMYQWTARQIAEQPLIVFDQKVKPGKLLIMLTALKTIFQKHR